MLEDLQAKTIKPVPSRIIIGRKQFNNLVKENLMNEDCRVINGIPLNIIDDFEGIYELYTDFEDSRTEFRPHPY